MNPLHIGFLKLLIGHEDTGFDLSPEFMSRETLEGISVMEVCFGLNLAVILVRTDLGLPALMVGESTRSDSAEARGLAGFSAGRRVN